MLNKMINKFEIFNIATGKWSVPELGKFPGGEIRVRLTSEYSSDSMVRIKAVILNSDDVMTLVMLTDALRTAGVENIRLTMPYIPYARQDRVCNKGEAFSLRAFARIINALEFESVVVWDAHSEVSTGWIGRCINVPQSDLIGNHVELMKWMVESTDPIYLVAPDAGSVRKATEIAQTYPTLIRDVLYAEKTRCISTGKITGTRIVSDIPDDLSESKVLVCDDIGDGFGTFIPLANEIRTYTPKELSIYVTHGIFSRGEDILYPSYDNVWCSIDFRKFS